MPQCRHQVGALLVLLAASGVASCDGSGQTFGATPEQLRKSWAGPDRDRVASYVSSERAIVGWRRSQVTAAFGAPDRGGRDDANVSWSNSCSGPGCYNLMVSYARGRVVDVGFLDEG